MEPFERFREAVARLRGWYPVRMGVTSFHCDPDHISFWDKVNSDVWEPQTFVILDRLLKPDTVYCDIGAWIGPTVLYAAGRCAKVYCLEPDPVAFMYLLQNIKLNKLKNVLPCNLALSVRDEICGMASPRGKRGDSMTSLLTPDGAGGMEVICLGWQSWFDLINSPVFNVIKMDIEGAEFGLLSTMREYLATHTPAVYLSLHPHLLPEKERFEAMAIVAEVFTPYDRCVDSSGNPLELSSLLTTPRVNNAGTYLLLP